MPPIRPQKSQRLVQQEGPLLLAIKAIKDGRYASAAAAARAFNVPVSNLKHRIKGRQFWNESRPSGHKFTVLEEKSMENWLLSMDSRGAALTHAMLRDMANLLLQSRELTPSNPAPKVGKIWTTEFVKRHETLSSRLSRKYNYERALSETLGRLDLGFALLKPPFKNMVLHLMISTILMSLVLQWESTLLKESSLLLNITVEEACYSLGIENGSL